MAVGTHAGAGTAPRDWACGGPVPEQRKCMRRKEQGKKKRKKAEVAARNHHVLTQPPVLPHPKDQQGLGVCNLWPKPGVLLEGD